jgi:GAF domain-containing protein
MRETRHAVRSRSNVEASGCGRSSAHRLQGKGGSVPDYERLHESDVLVRLDEVTDALSGLRGMLEREEALGRVMQRAVDLITSAVPTAAMASVTVLRNEEPETVACSSERVWALDSDQYAAGEGPCLEAARIGQVVRATLEQARERWPGFAGSAQKTGVASYMSAPLVLDDEFAGSLNLYSEKPEGFGDLDEALLRLYVTAVTAAVANARRYVEVCSLADQLGQALESREMIGQAIGVLMATRGFSAEEAFQELSRQSQNTNTKLREIAGWVVAGARR